MTLLNNQQTTIKEMNISLSSDVSARLDESLNRLLGLFYLARSEQAQTQRRLSTFTADPMTLMANAHELTQIAERNKNRTQELGRSLIDLAWLTGSVSQALQRLSQHLKGGELEELLSLSAQRSSNDSEVPAEDTLKRGPILKTNVVTPTVEVQASSQPSPAQDQETRPRPSDQFSATTASYKVIAEKVGHRDLTAFTYRRPTFSSDDLFVQQFCAANESSYTSTDRIPSTPREALLTQLQNAQLEAISKESQFSAQYSVLQRWADTSRDWSAISREIKFSMLTYLTALWRYLQTLPKDLRPICAQGDNAYASIGKKLKGIARTPGDIFGLTYVTSYDSEYVWLQRAQSAYQTLLDHLIPARGEDHIPREDRVPREDRLRGSDVVRVTQNSSKTARVDHDDAEPELDEFESLFQVRHLRATISSGVKSEIKQSVNNLIDSPHSTSSDPRLGEILMELDDYPRIFSGKSYRALRKNISRRLKEGDHLSSHLELETDSVITSDLSADLSVDTSVDTSMDISVDLSVDTSTDLSVDLSVDTDDTAMVDDVARADQELDAERAVLLSVDPKDKPKDKPLEFFVDVESHIESYIELGVESDAESDAELDAESDAESDVESAPDINDSKEEPDVITAPQESVNNCEFSLYQTCLLGETSPDGNVSGDLACAALANTSSDTSLSSRLKVTTSSARMSEDSSPDQESDDEDLTKDMLKAKSSGSMRELLAMKRKMMRKSSSRRQKNKSAKKKTATKRKSVKRT